MNNNNFKVKAKDLMTDVQIKGFYQINKNKGITYGFAEMLHYYGAHTVIEDITFSKTLDEFYQKITEKLGLYVTRPLFPSILSGFIFGIFNANTMIEFSESQSRLLFQHHFNPTSSKRFVEEYKTIIFEYLNNKHPEMKLTQQHINEFIKLIFEDQSKLQPMQMNLITLVTKVVLEMQTLYTADILFNNKDFVEFEIKNGIFERHSLELNKNLKVPTPQERITNFEEQKVATDEEKGWLEDLDLLDVRVNKLSQKYKQDLFTKLKFAKAEGNTRKKLDLIDDCYSMYEIEFRKEIIDSLYTPSHSTEINHYKDLNNILIHIYGVNKKDLVNQISTSFFSPEKILTLNTCVGICFDKTIRPDSIGMSSIKHDDNKVVQGNNFTEIFRYYSVPLSELKQSNKTELLLFQQLGTITTKPSYIAIILDGKNPNEDHNTYLKAKNFALENSLYYIVFNLPEIKKSISNQEINTNKTNQ